MGPFTNYVMYFSRFFTTYTETKKYPPIRDFSRRFSLKTAFLKWIFEADPGGVQIRAVSHFNGLEETFKMR